MGLFDKAKELFSDGGITLDAQLAPDASFTRGVAPGTVTITGEKPDTVTKVTVSLTKRSVIMDNNQVAENSDEVLSTLTIEQPGALTPGQPLSIPFELNLKDWIGLPKHLMGIDEKVQSEGGILGGLSKGLDMVGGKSRNYHYFLTVMCDVASRSMPVNKDIDTTINA